MEITTATSRFYYENTKLKCVCVCTRALHNTLQMFIIIESEREIGSDRKSNSLLRI